MAASSLNYLLELLFLIYLVFHYKFRFSPDDLKLQNSNQMKAAAISRGGNENWGQYLTVTELSGGVRSNDQAELVNPQLDVEAGISVFSAERKRRGRRPNPTTQEEKKRKKNQADKDRRKDHTDKFQRLTKVASDFGGIDELESFVSVQANDQKEPEYEQFKRVKLKHGELEEIDTKLSKLKQLEAEVPLFEKVKTMFGGIQNIDPGLDKLKKTEFQQILMSTQKEMEFNSTQNEKAVIDFFPESSDSFQEQMQSMNSNNLGSIGDSDLVASYGLSQMWFLGPDTEYSDDGVDCFIAKLEKDTKSNVNLSSFKGLDGERQRVGDYNIPISLVSTAKAIMDARGDITENCLFNPTTVENIYVLLCAAIKEMGDLLLDQVNEDIIIKWNDPIKDAKRSGFDVEFAWEHLKKIALAYFGFKARSYKYTLQLRTTNLIDAQKQLRQQLEMNEKEMETVKAKEEKLRSQKCKKYQDFADEFKDRNVGLFRDNFYHVCL